MYEIFPLMVPMKNSSDFRAVQADFPFVEPGAGRNSVTQGGFQMLALVITLIIAIIGGAVTGKSAFTILKLKLSRALP